jgi:hypothetical protein
MAARHLTICEVVQPDPDEPAELLGDAFALCFRMSSSARCYTTAEYTGWLGDAGFVDVQVQPFPLTSAIAVISGRTPER